MAQLPSINIYLSLLLSILLFGVSASNSEWEKPQSLDELNSSGDDYAPYILPVPGTADRIFLYSSSKSNTKLEVAWPLTNDIIPSPTRLLHEDIIGYISLYDDQLFSSYARKSARQTYSSLGYSKYIKQRYHSPLLIDSLACECFTAQPTVSSDGAMLAFVSNRFNKDINDTDIWLVKKQANGEWGLPYSFDLINSEYREITPYFSGDTLFFASDGLGGPGGLDIFYTYLENGIWSRPSAFPHNSPYNDSDPMAAPDGSLIFASDRPEGKGGLDLYLSKFKLSELTDITEDIEIKLRSYTGRVVFTEEQSYQKYPLPHELKFLDTQSNEFQLSEFDSPYGNLMLLGLAERFRGTVGQMPKALRLSVQLDNRLETEGEKNQKYYSDQRIKNLYDKVAEIYKEKYQEELEGEISQYLEVDYETVRGGIRKSVLIEAEDDLCATLITKNYDAQPDVLGLALNCSESPSVNKWQLHLQNNDNGLLIAEGIGLPGGTIEYPLKGNEDFYKSVERNGYTDIYARIFDSENNVLAEDSYQLEVSHSLVLGIKNRIQDNALYYDLFIKNDEGLNPIIEKLESELGSRWVAAQQINLFYPSGKHSEALLLADRLQDQLKKNGREISVSALAYDPTKFLSDIDIPNWLYGLQVVIPIRHKASQ